METKIDIYNYDRMLNSAMKLMRNADISQKNKQLIEDYSNFCFANGIGKPRVIKYVRTLRQLAEWLKLDFNSAQKSDIERLITIIQRNERYSEWTKVDFNVVLKKFYKWISGGKGYPECVEWLRTRPNKSKVKLPGSEGLLTEADIKVLINAADHPRNKALVALLYESGCRIGEIASLKLNNVVFDEKGAILAVHGKTGSRRIRIVSSVYHLLTWINSHPLNDDPSAPLWINVGAVNHRRYMKYGALRTVLHDIFLVGGIKKKFNPHIFRHSRATFLANYLTEAQLKVYFGWTQGSDVAGTYVHLSGRDTDMKILEINGVIEETKKKQDELKPKNCPRCKAMNAHNSNYCSKCSSIMNIETAMKEQETMMRVEKTNVVTNDIMNELMNDSDVQKILLQKIQQLKLGGKLHSLPGVE